MVATKGLVEERVKAIEVMGAETEAHGVDAEEDAVASSVASAEASVAREKVATVARGAAVTVDLTEVVLAPETAGSMVQAAAWATAARREVATAVKMVDGSEESTAVSREVWKVV